jgi:hypothetical protein
MPIAIARMATDFFQKIVGHSGYGSKKTGERRSALDELEAVMFELEDLPAVWPDKRNKKIVSGIRDFTDDNIAFQPGWKSLRRLFLAQIIQPALEALAQFGPGFGRRNILGGGMEWVEPRDNDRYGVAV